MLVLYLRHYPISTPLPPAIDFIFKLLAIRMGGPQQEWLTLTPTQNEDPSLYQVKAVLTQQFMNR